MDIKYFFLVYSVINICIYCKMITIIILLISIAMNSYKLFFTMMRNWNDNYSLNDFWIYNILLLTVVTMLYITSSEFISFITGSLYFWLPSHISLILSTTCHWQPPICSLYLSCFSVCFLLSDSEYKWNYSVFVFHDWLISLSIVPSRSIWVVANGKNFLSIHQSWTLRLFSCLSYCK